MYNLDIRNILYHCTNMDDNHVSQDKNNIVIEDVLGSMVDGNTVVAKLVGTVDMWRYSP
jgi:hypothetical protein